MPTALAISGSPSSSSKTAQLLLHALDQLRRAGVDGRLIDVGQLTPAALLGRERAADVDAALAAVADARILVVGTPVYRASFSGLLKVFFDLLPQDGLAGTIAIPIATGGSPAHMLVIDHALRPLVASVGGVTVASGVYGSQGQFDGVAPDTRLLARVDQAVAEALALAAQLSSPSR